MWVYPGTAAGSPTVEEAQIPEILDYRRATCPRRLYLTLSKQKTKQNKSLLC